MPCAAPLPASSSRLRSRRFGLAGRATFTGMLGSPADGADDVLVTGAAADVAGDGLPDGSPYRRSSSLFPQPTTFSPSPQPLRSKRQLEPTSFKVSSKVTHHGFLSGRASATGAGKWWQCLFDLRSSGFQPGRQFELAAQVFNRLIDGFVDAYFGPSDLRREVEAGPTPEPAALAGQARELLAALPSAGFAQNLAVV